jgi:hypothetical protein
MSRELLLERLDAAERQIVRYDYLIQKQRAIVSGLERSGYDAVQARELLAQFEESRTAKIAQRDRLLAKVKSLGIEPAR